MIPWLTPGMSFPPVDQALDAPNGLLAATATVSAPRLVEAYRLGIFPWYSEGEPVLWWSPDPRMVLFTDELCVSRSLRKRARALASEPAAAICLNRDFVGTMRACAAPRAEQPGTWITDEIIDSYAELHRHGLAHSVELWSDDECIGGLYGVALGRMFYGESMFSRVRDASKITLLALVRLLRNERAPVIDCQQKTAHLASLGAREIRRSDFCATVAQAVKAPSIDWSRYADHPLNELLLTN